MRVEKNIKRTDGTKIKIVVTLHVFGLGGDRDGNIFRYDVNVAVCPKRKHNFYYVDNHLDYVTEEEILDVKMNVWNQLKPGV